MASDTGLVPAGHKIDAVACWREEEVGLAAVGDRYCVRATIPCREPAHLTVSLFPGVVACMSFH